MWKQYVMQLHIIPYEWTFRSLRCLFEFFQDVAFSSLEKLYFFFINHWKARNPTFLIHINCEYTIHAVDAAFVFICFSKHIRWVNAEDIRKETGFFSKGCFNVP